MNIFMLDFIRQQSKSTNKNSGGIHETEQDDFLYLDGTCDGCNRIWLAGSYLEGRDLPGKTGNSGPSTLIIASLASRPDPGMRGVFLFLNNIYYLKNGLF
ncbi:MAG: hypothetical protein A2Z52_01935 [Candidatus Moranbacteria bacterium RBG_19FT_COMBO_42_6]|nr:MAG: hypothetical protein A2Z52_01935 [Candidatus Moranbacteria bacterium RBG_19FT_COMBO_42_6]